MKTSTARPTTGPCIVALTVAAFTLSAVTTLAGTPVASADPISITHDANGVSASVSSPVQLPLNTPLPLNLGSTLTLSNTSSGQSVNSTTFAGLITTANVSNASNGQTVSVGTSTGGLICTCAKVTLSDVAGQPPITIAHSNP